MEDQAFVTVQFGSSPTPSLPQHVVSLFLSSYVSPVDLSDVMVEGGWVRTQIIRRRVSLVLYIH
jgi:hypothetical protein